jgi:hypothetical protein
LNKLRLQRRFQANPKRNIALTESCLTGEASIMRIANVGNVETDQWLIGVSSVSGNLESSEDVRDLECRTSVAATICMQASIAFETGAKTRNSRNINATVWARVIVRICFGESTAQRLPTYRRLILQWQPR